MNVVSFPLNTKDAIATIHKFTVTVKCPHCNGIHHHAKVSLYMTYILAPCGKGYYVLRKPKTYTIVCNGCGYSNVTTDADLRQCAKCGGHVYMTKSSLIKKGK